MKEALKAFDGLPNFYPQTNVAFSPDEQIILTGTSVDKDSTTGGLLCFYDRTKLEIVQKVGISPTSSVVQCAWHPRLNQVNNNNNVPLRLFFDISLREAYTVCRYLQHLETKGKEELTFFTTQFGAREVRVCALHVHQGRNL